MARDEPNALKIILNEGCLLNESGVVEEADEMAQKTNDWVRNLDSTKIMWPYKEYEKRKLWSDG